MNQKYCEECNALIEENADYCHKCGAITLKLKDDIRRAEEEIKREEEIRRAEEEIKKEKEIYAENKEKHRKKYFINPDKNKDLAIIISLLLPFTGYFYLKDETILSILIIIETFSFLFLISINFTFFVLLYLVLTLISFIALYDLVNKNKEVNDVYMENGSVFNSKNFGKIGSVASLSIGVFLISILHVALSQGGEAVTLLILLICIFISMPGIFMNISKDKISVKRYMIYGFVSLFGGFIILGFIPSIFFFVAAILLSKENYNLNNVISTLECYNCEKINKSESIFCENCGTRLEKDK
ncbi:MAG: hypothetical protein ACRCVG_01485 [Methanobacteriaceae archaeon]